MPDIQLLDTNGPVFPSPENALQTPNGLLAMGGNLKQSTLLDAYRQGIFPWYEDDQPLLWWSPDPRAVIFPEDIRVSRSLKKAMNRQPWEIRLDTHFLSVVECCSGPRRNNETETWITGEMIEAYLALHATGIAHSVEVWLENELVGGLYGVLVGSVFCGESMFSLQPNASKVALVQLALLVKEQTDGGFIDCQISNEHLTSMGAVTLSRQDFLLRLAKLRDQRSNWPDQWRCKMPEIKV